MRSFKDWVSAFEGSHEDLSVIYFLVKILKILLKENLWWSFEEWDLHYFWDLLKENSDEELHVFS